MLSPLLMKSNLAAGFLLFFLLLNVLFSASHYFSEIKYISVTRNLDQEERLNRKYGDFYDLCRIIRKGTTETESVFFFRDVMDVVHHRPLLSGFLFPRKIYWDCDIDKIREKNGRGVLLCRDLKVISGFSPGKLRVQRIKWQKKNIYLVRFN